MYGCNDFSCIQFTLKLCIKSTPLSLLIYFLKFWLNKNIICIEKEVCCLFILKNGKINWIVENLDKFYNFFGWFMGTFSLNVYNTDKHLSWGVASSWTSNFELYLLYLLTWNMTSYYLFFCSKAAISSEYWWSARNMYYYTSWHETWHTIIYFSAVRQQYLQDIDGQLVTCTMSWSLVQQTKIWLFQKS